MSLVLIAYLCFVTVQMITYVIQVCVTVQLISCIIQVSHDKNGQYSKIAISFIDHVAMKNVFYCIYSNMLPILWMRQGHIYDNISALLGYTNFAFIGPNPFYFMYLIKNDNDEMNVYFREKFHEWYHECCKVV